MTSKLGRFCGLVDSDFTNDEFLGHYPIHNAFSSLTSKNKMYALNGPNVSIIDSPWAMYRPPPHGHSFSQ